MMMMMLLYLKDNLRHAEFLFYHIYFTGWGNITMHMWRPEDRPLKEKIPPTMWVPGIELR